MPPGVFARGAEGQATGQTRLGRLLLAATDRGVCAVELGEDDEALERLLRRQFPRATLARAPDSIPLRRWLTALEEHLDGRRPHPGLPLDVRTTAFRHRVYRALQAIPEVRRVPTRRWRGHWPAEGCARGGEGLCHQLGSGAHPLPPRATR